jgi:hypothetical protein
MRTVRFIFNVCSCTENSYSINYAIYSYVKLLSQLGFTIHYGVGGVAY